jgi:hypothetical protein
VAAHRQQRGWRIVTAIALLLSLLFILPLVHASHGVAFDCFVFIPVLFWALLNIPLSLWPVQETRLTLPHQAPERSALFQRPPPSFFA